MRNRIPKLIFGNFLLAVVLVILYSPGLIGLSFSWDKPFTTALASAAAVIALGVFLIMNRAFLKEEKPEMAGHSEQNKQQKAKEILAQYTHSSALGSIARSALNQMERISYTADAYEKLTANRYGMASPEYVKYIDILWSAQAAMENGYAGIANRMLIFNESEYELLSSGKYRNDAIPNETQEEHLRVYMQTLDRMKKMLGSGERLLTALDRMMSEIADAETTNQVLEKEVKEITGLMKQMEYYKRDVSV